MPQKRVPESVYRRRRITALIILLLLILFIVILANSCSKDDKKGDKKQKNKKSTTTVTQETTMPTTVDPQFTITTTAVNGLNGDGVTEGTAPASPDGSTVEKIDLTFYTVTLDIGEKKMPIVTMSPSTATDKSEIWETSNKAVATVDEKGNITAVGAGTCYITVTSKSNPTVYAEVKVTVNQGDGLDNVQQTAMTENGAPAEATYVKGILIANKSYGLPADYNPGLDATAKSQFDVLAADAKKEGLNIYLSSGFRTYQYQEKIYNNYVALYGQATADSFSARPGYSEHQTGLAIDVNSIDDSFAATEEAKWLEANAHKYGFIIRYPKGKENITGYKYESWHIRYLGVETATAVYNSGLTLEEYLGIDSKYRG